MTPLKAAIFDRIKSAHREGVSSRELIAELYFDRRRVSETTIKAHVSQINDLLCGTDWRIRSDRRCWRLVSEPWRMS